MFWRCWRKGQGEWEAKMKASFTSPDFALFNTCMVGVIRGDRSREGAGVGWAMPLGIGRPTKFPS